MSITRQAWLELHDFTAESLTNPVIGYNPKTKIPVGTYEDDTPAFFNFENKGSLCLTGANATRRSILGAQILASISLLNTSDSAFFVWGLTPGSEAEKLLDLPQLYAVLNIDDSDQSQTWMQGLTDEIATRQGLLKEFSVQSIDQLNDLDNDTVVPYCIVYLENLETCTPEIQDFVSTLARVARTLNIFLLYTSAESNKGSGFDTALISDTANTFTLSVDPNSEVHMFELDN